MYSLKNEFSENREVLGEQYINAWHNDGAYARYDALLEKVSELAERMSELAHPIVKARCFEYIVMNAPVYLNPDDWFGIALEAVKMDKILDIGCHHRQIFNTIRVKWMREIDGEMNPPEDAVFTRFAREYLNGDFWVDYSHSVPCWEDIFALGISGLRRRIEDYRERLMPLDEEGLAYFEGMRITYDAVLKLFDRLIAVLAGRSEPRLVAMKNALENLRKAPPANTYEALLLSWLYWFLQENIDCVRVRTMGGIDRLYYGFYKRDLENGTFSEEDIREMFLYYMNAFYAFRVAYDQPMYLGGLDDDGHSVVNELSYLFLEEYEKLSRPSPKLQAVVGDFTPDDFLEAVMRSIRNGNSSISIINHDIAMRSLERLGVPRREARAFQMAGCWDYTVKNHEVKTVTNRVSLPKVLELTMTGGYDLNTGELVGLEAGTDFASFDELFNAYKRQWLYIWRRMRTVIERWERYLDVISPSNMFSATMTDSLEKGVDGYARGMKYNTSVYQVFGMATLVDSLLVLRKFVFETGEIAYTEFMKVLEANWQGYEELQRRILSDFDKYGNGSELADRMTVELADFFSENVNGAPNSRGGYWKLGMLSIDKNLYVGRKTGATPDGRLSGKPLSKNLSPVSGMDRKGITALINSVTKIDFVNFPHSGMMDFVLHPSSVSGDDGLAAFCGIVKVFFKKGGHSCQFNVFSAETLKDAQKHPEKYKNLQVRVCGWNVYFIDLDPAMQDEFIRQSESAGAMSI